MAKVVLHECRFRGGRFTPDPAKEAQVFTFPELMARFDLRSEDPIARAKLICLQPRAYIGLIKGSLSGKAVAFVLLNPDNGTNYTWLTKKDPEFETRLIEVFRVLEVEKDGMLREYSPPARGREVAA